jgi:uncharacterized membrane protein
MARRRLIVIAKLRGYLIAGLLVWVPLGITVLVVKLLVDLMDRSVLLLPPAWRPEAIFGFNMPGLGFALTFVVVILTGVAVANLIGRQLVAAWESLLARIPLVRTIYSVVKQVVQTVLSTDSNAFRKVLLVEYPRKDCWTVAFMAGEGTDEVHDRLGREMTTVFVPHAPNFTSGFIILVPKEEVIVLDMSVEEGMKMIMSLGVTLPPPTRGPVEVDAEAAASSRPAQI